MQLFRLPVAIFVRGALSATGVIVREGPYWNWPQVEVLTVLVWGSVFVRRPLDVTGGEVRTVIALGVFFVRRALDITRGNLRFLRFN